MAYNTKPILVDLNKKPIPQFYDPATDAFLPLTGVDLGGGKYGADNLIYGKTAGGVYAPVQIDANGRLVTTAELSGSIVATETDKAVTANTDILTDYTATKTMQTTLMVATNTSGILKLEVDGSLNSLNGGIALTTDQWYAFDIPILAESVYNLQLSAGATMQIKWIGGF